jgi:hypothetical protein
VPRRAGTWAQGSSDAFSAESLLAEQAEETEEAIWSAVRALEESASLERRMLLKLSGSIVRRHEESAAAKERNARLLRRMLLGAGADPALLGEDDADVKCAGAREDE